MQLLATLRGKKVDGRRKSASTAQDSSLDSGRHRLYPTCLGGVVHLGLSGDGVKNLTSHEMPYLGRESATKN